MRILVVTPDLPSKNSAHGGATRQFYLLRRLLDRGHEVTIVALVPAGREAEVAELESIGFRINPVYRPAKRIVELLAAVARRPSILLRVFSLPVTPLALEVFWTRMRPVALRELDAGVYDRVIVEHDYAMSWIRDIEGLCPVISSHECMSGNYTATLAARATGMRRRWHELEALRYARFTSRWLPRFDAVVSVSDFDAELARGYLGGDGPPVLTVPNGADCTELATVGTDHGDPTVLFTGTLAYLPNADAAKWLATEIWPRVLEQLPEAKLYVVGRDPGADVRALDAPPYVNVTGAVPSMLPFFENAALCVAPVRIGGGTRLKIIEAWAAGRAVVAHTVGATGLDVEDGTNIAIADDAAGFADQIVELLGDDDRRQAMATAGRETALAKYDWASLGDSYAAAVTGEPVAATGAVGRV